MALPTPVSRADMYLSYLNYTKGLTLDDLPTPVSRSDMYLYNLCVNRGIGGGSGGSNVTINGETQTNFNFIKNKVVQDGLVGAVFENKPSIIEIKKASKYTIQFVGKYNLTHGIYSGIFGMYHKNGTPAYYYLDSPSANEQALRLRVGEDVPNTTAIVKNYNELFTIKSNLIIQIDETESTVTIVLNGIKNTRRYTLRNAEDTFNLYLLKTSIEASDFNGDVAGLLVYNRLLTPQEIQHNFSVLNNESSIKELHTTDSTGKTSILKIASDSHHVEMDTGRTLQEELDTYRAIMGKEFTSADGSAIDVNNAIPSKVLSAEMQGNTIKNIVSGVPAEIDHTFTGTAKIWEYDVIGATPGKQYTFICDIVTNTSTTANYCPFPSGERNSVSGSHNVIKTGFTGRVEYLFTSKPAFTATPKIEFYVSGATAGDRIVVRNIRVVEGDMRGKNSNEYIPFGLSSTEAIISNNGQQYPIYATEEDKANKKVISLPFAEDKMMLNEDGSVTWVNASTTIETKNFTWSKDISSNDEYFVGKITVPNTSFAQTEFNVISDILDSEKGTLINTYKGEKCVIGGWNNVIVIKIKSNFLSSNDVTGFNTWIKDNNPILTYKLNPTSVSIPKELVPTILTQQTNILEAGGAVKPSSFKVTLPVDRIAEIEARLQALESTTVDVVLNK